MKKICDFDTCDRKVYSKGLCSTHYQQRISGKELTPIRRYSLREKEICKFNGCDRIHNAKGYCSAHYLQLINGKTLKPLSGRAMSTHERFEEKISSKDGCWIWCGAKGNSGYGTFSLEGRMVGAHRVSYMLYVGEIPEGMEVDHICHNAPCVNPDHLRILTREQNNNNRTAQPRNKTGVRGVTVHKPTGKYLAQTVHKRVNYYLGLHDDIDSAKKAVEAKRQELQKELAGTKPKKVRSLQAIRKARTTTRQGNHETEHSSHYFR